MATSDISIATPQGLVSILIPCCGVAYRVPGSLGDSHFWQSWEPWEPWYPERNGNTNRR